MASEEDQDVPVQIYVDDIDPVDEKFRFDYSEETREVMKGVGKPSWQESDSVRQ